MRPNSFLTLAGIQAVLSGMKKDRFMDIQAPPRESPTSTTTTIDKPALLSAASELVYEWQARSMPLLGVRAKGAANSATPHSATVIFLHGLGDTGEGWAEAFGGMMTKHLPHVKFIFPTAQEIPVSLNFKMKMPAWYDIKGLGPRMHEEAIGLVPSVLFIQSLLLLEGEVLKEAGVSGDRPRLMVGGFSQGGALSLHASHSYYDILAEGADKQQQQTNSPQLAGSIALSSYITAQNLLLEHWQPDHDKIPLYWGHGDCDEMIPTAIGKNSFDAMVHYKARSRGDIDRHKKAARDAQQKEGPLSSASVPSVSAGQSSSVVEDHDYTVNEELLRLREEVFKVYRGMGHSSCEAELRDVMTFMKLCLPPPPPPPPPKKG